MRTGPPHVDREPDRVPGRHAAATHQPLVEHVETRYRADGVARLRDRRDRLGQHLAAARGACLRAASSEANSSEFGLVDSTSVTVRSTTS